MFSPITLVLVDILLFGTAERELRAGLFISEMIVRLSEAIASWGQETVTAAIK
jgi:hypothetical protein